MILISNNVRDMGIPYPQDAVIRINTAWLNDPNDLRGELAHLKSMGREVYLDYPIGRRKPPFPTITWSEILEIVKEFDNIKYFAWSNAEAALDLEVARSYLPQRVVLVPKIESLLGVLHLEEIVRAAETTLIMIDKEDLAAAANNDPEIYQHFLDYTRKKAQALNILAIELQGVVFA